MPRLDHRHTLAASYVGYVTQAIINNLGPLMFIIWHDSFGISFSALGAIVAFNFGFQLLVDLVAPKAIDAVGYRVSMVVAHVTAAAGLIAMGVLPFVAPSPLLGLILATGICAFGGGLLEVLVSPVVEACPTENKAFHMSLLHSFYCWGHVAVVALSTVGFLLLGEDRWPLLCFAWAIVPALNAVLLWFVPYFPLVTEGTPMRYIDLLRRRRFWLLVLLMLAAGASEQAMSQWASAYAQAGLGLEKTMGDLLGPLMFAVCMGLSRVIFGSRATRDNVSRIMIGTLTACVAAYLLAALSPWPGLGLVGVALGGFSVGMLWPGTFTVGSAAFPRGGTVLFALLALGGDAGCALGPAVVGVAADATGSLSTAMLTGTVFPVLMIAGLLLLRRHTPAPTRTPVQIPG
ncbi:MFS transporter [Tessaracoccus defluvii]|uniref:MFS transporter n=1 Tax=Tessaracoccus defluvii TaxID=1285901 RepID=A0A7H0H700_9ACTN|nr:MFS transporter [Tessaracoccus defluvii]QNP56316.1 MFS transporter [Tessaracoccus defluvii]